MTLSEDIKRIRRNITNTHEGMNYLISCFSDVAYISLDTETTSLNITKLKIVGISLYNGKEDSFYIPVGHSFGNQLPLSFVINTLREVLKDKRLIFHNIVYDGMVLRKFKLNLLEHKYFDTMIAAHLVYEERQSHGLKHLALAELKYKMKNFDEICPDPSNIENISIESISDYACEDAILTYKLFELYREELKKKELNDLFYNIEMPFQKTLIMMKEVGVVLDTKKLKELETEITRESNEIKQKIFSFNKSNQQTLFGEGIQAFDIDSPQQMVEFLYIKLKLPIIERTEKGMAATGTPVLMKMKDKHEVIPLIIKYRKLAKLYTSYIMSLPKRLDSDGRIRCDFKDHGTETGRLSSSNPNLQQLPRNDDIELKKYDIRECFIADKGKRILAMDYAQEETRVACHIAKEESMMDSIRKGYDFHMNTANLIFHLNLTPEELTDGTPEFNLTKKKYKTKRQYAKNISFGLLYGMGPAGLASNLNITKDEASQLIEQYFAQFKDMKKAIEECHQSIKRQKYVTNLFGRRRNFKEIDAEAMRQGFNFLIQGSCADILRVTCNNIYKFLEDNNFEAKIIMLVHDEIVLEVPEDKTKFYLENLSRIMSNSIQLDVPLTADGGEGQTYRAAK